MNQEETFDSRALDLELDKVKSKVFMLTNAAFLACLMANVNFSWNTQIPTASIGNNELQWNPHWFISLVPETRKTVLVHEIWHEALLHNLRRGLRDPRIWNYACDIFINNNLEKEGYSFEGVEDCWKDQQFAGMTEEAIYDELMKNAVVLPPGGSWGPDDSDDGDIEKTPPNKIDVHTAVNNVMRAVQQARIAKQAGSIPGSVLQLLDQFLKPKVPWQSVLNKFFTDLIEEDYSWRRPRRRIADIYLPSLIQDEGRLEHLIYFQDVSGSIGRKDMIRFNSEIRHVKNKYQPKKMTIVQFDWIIKSVLVVEDDDVFDQVKINGGGGTSFVPVRDFIEKHKPTAAIIFSDMECTPMEPPSFKVPIIWVAVNARRANVKVGKVIHIKE